MNGNQLNNLKYLLSLYKCTFSCVLDLAEGSKGSKKNTSPNVICLQYIITSSTDFSLSQWKVENYICGALEPYQISELLEMLNLQPYMKSSACSRQQPMYSSAGPNGWQNGKYTVALSFLQNEILCKYMTCIPGSYFHSIQWIFVKLWYALVIDFLYIIATNRFFDIITECTRVDSLPSLHQSPLTCNLDHTCTKVTCCIDSPLINSTFEVMVNVDPCNRMLHLGIENLKAHIPFKDINWGNPCTSYNESNRFISP